MTKKVEVGTATIDVKFCGRYLLVCKLILSKNLAHNIDLQGEIYCSTWINEIRAVHCATCNNCVVSQYERVYILFLGSL